MFRPKQFSLVLLALLIASCDFSTEPSDFFVLPAIDVPWTSGQSVVCFGTSLTAGFMWDVATRVQWMVVPRIPEAPTKVTHATDNDSTSYPALLQQRLQIKVYNEGYVGATTLYAMSRVDTVFARNPALVLLEFGANDLLQNLPDSLTEVRLGRLIDTLQSSGTKVVLVSFIHAEMIDNLPPDHYFESRKQMGHAYLTMLRNVAQARGILFVEYAMKGIYWNESLMSDGIHPNRPGYKLMMENIYQAMQKTFERNGMIK
jgi:lysophospholipase L1-like esterase